MRNIRIVTVAGCKVPKREIVVRCDRCKKESTTMYSLKSTSEDLCEHCLLQGIVNSGLATPLMI